MLGLVGLGGDGLNQLHACVRLEQCSVYVCVSLYDVPACVCGRVYVGMSMCACVCLCVYVQVCTKLVHKP